MKKIAAMVDQFHKVKMDELIDKELEEKKINDRIVVFAQEKDRVSYVRDKYGLKVSSVKATAQKGNQSFKYQEIIRRQEAIAAKEQRKADKIEA